MRITSKKEKNLWISLIIVLVGIYSTLGIAQPISDILLKNRLLTPLFFLGMLLVGITVMVYGINKNPSKSLTGISLGIAAVYLMILVRIEIPQERTHLIEYSVVAVLIHEILIERVKHGSKVLYPAILAILATGFTGIIDEFIQKFVPNRVFDFRDVLFNFLAGMMAIGSVVLLRWMGKISSSRK